jgi:cellulose synthase/poly-beta-1,6-N-acetylglucosamine synthase-like glycosyltransferase
VSPGDDPRAFYIARWHAQQQAGLAALAKLATITETVPAPARRVDVPRYPHGDRLSDPYRGGPHRQRQGADPRAPGPPPPRPSSRHLSATVLIPAHNEAETVYDLVRACVEQRYPLDDIVVVADSCTDDTAEAAWEAGATRIIEVDYQDKAMSQNAALFDIHTDLVIGFDGDTIPEPDCIERMIADIRRGYDATCATILPIQPRGFFIRARRFAYALGRRWWRLCQAKVGRIQVLTGACYVFRTNAIKSVGGFPGGLISADMDATWALHKARYKLGYTGDAIALTYDPETFRVYRQQMRRWSSGYFQNMAKYRRELLHWRSMLVVWTALLDLFLLFAYEIALVFSLATGHYRLAASFAIWLTIHAIITIILVATVVGVKEALLGYLPYLLVNYYNKWLYLCAFVREWILGRHYSSWTGRQGRKTVITAMTGARKLALSFIALILVAGGVAVARFGHFGQRPPVVPVDASRGPRVPGHTSAGEANSVRYIGVITPAPSVYQLDKFAQRIGAGPNMAEYYVHWGQPLRMDRAVAVSSVGARPFISWEPTTVSLASIAAGRSDAYIRQQARAVAGYGKPVVITFGAEMNGHWETWGPGHATPAQFVAAWRHLHDIFAAAQVTNVTWVWTVNIINGLKVPIRPYWPGPSYVDWVGMDGYFWRPSFGLTFNAVFGPTVNAVRAFTSKPLLITETGGIQGMKVIAVRDLFSGVEHTPGMLGFVWFDIRNSKGDFRLETSPAALAAFRQNVASLVTNRS